MQFLIPSALCLWRKAPGMLWLAYQAGTGLELESAFIEIVANC